VEANYSEFDKNWPGMFDSSDPIVAAVEDNCNLLSGLLRRASKNWKLNLCWFSPRRKANCVVVTAYVTS